MPEFKPRTVTVSIYQGDDMARIGELRQAADIAIQAEQSGLPRTLGEVGATASVEEHNAFVAEAETRATKVRIQALGRKQWRSLVAAHPPRDGNDEDKAVGVNEETFADALVPASIVEPTFPTPADMEAFLDALSDAQFNELYLNAFALNRAVGQAPKALSAPSPSSDAT